MRQILSEIMFVKPNKIRRKAGIRFENILLRPFLRYIGLVDEFFYFSKLLFQANYVYDRRRKRKKCFHFVNSANLP